MVPGVAAPLLALVLAAVVLGDGVGLSAAGMGVTAGDGLVSGDAVGMSGTVTVSGDEVSAPDGLPSAGGLSSDAAGADARDALVSARASSGRETKALRLAGGVVLLTCPCMQQMLSSVTVCALCVI